MQNTSRRAALALPLAAAPLLTARAEDWKPAQQVRLLVASAPGGTTDIMARLLSPRLQARWGVSVVAENRAGAGGTICTLEMVRSRLVTASARTRPDRMCSITPVRLSIRKFTLPASRSTCAGPEPRKGTWMASPFSSCSISTGERCVDCPTPVEA